MVHKNEKGAASEIPLNSAIASGVVFCSVGFSRKRIPLDYVHLFTRITKAMRKAELQLVPQAWQVSFTFFISSTGLLGNEIGRQGI